jgi:hypothetical protein
MLVVFIQSTRSAVKFSADLRWSALEVDVSRYRLASDGRGIAPDRHDSYPGAAERAREAIQTKLGEGVRHRTSRYLNNRGEQARRGVKGRYP